MADREDVHARYSFEVADDDNLTTPADEDMVQQDFCVVSASAMATSASDGSLGTGRYRSSFTEATSDDMRALASRAGDGDLSA